MPLLLVLSVASGAAALIYETVWLQLLQLVIGSSAISIAVLLGTFMGGMCLGSLLFPRIPSEGQHPLRVYGAIEAAIGAMGLLLLALAPFIGRLYAAWGGYAGSGFLVRAVVASVCLLPPTVAMGATLPALARAVERSRQPVAWVGAFYSANIAGGVCGTLVAGFYLLRVYDMSMATYVAAALNFAVAAAAWVMTSSALRTSGFRFDEGSERAAGENVAGLEHPENLESQNPVYVSIALSGFCALAAEAIWTRLLALLLGPTVYTFSLVLAVFLVGLGIGSTAGAALTRWVETIRAHDRPAHRASADRARLAFGICQALSAAAIAWSAIVLDNVLPYLSVRTNASMWSSFWFDIGRAAWAILPASLLWGASFPLALASLPIASRRISGSVGVLYAANTAGAILGVISATMILVPVIGSQRTQQLMIGAAAAAALLTLTPRRTRFVIPVFAAACVWLVPAVPGLLIAYGRYAGNWVSHAGDVVYVGEGLNSSVAVSRTSDGVFNYHNAGKVQASTEPQDMRLQRMLGHLTTLLVERPRSVLVIGCGAGVTAGAVSIDPAVERVTIAEIEPLVPAVVSSYFRLADHDVIRNPKVRVVIDDARHVVTAGGEKFDAITSDPLDPWVKGAAALYTKEFFEAARAHLNPGGVLTVFVQLYHSSPNAVKSEIATFLDVFPDGVIWANAVYGQAYDMVLYGQVGPPEIDVDNVNWRLKQPQYADVARSLGEVGIASAEDLLSTYSGRLRDLRPWLLDAPINRDRNLRLQYLAGLDVDAQQGIRMYGEMLQYRRFPEGLFVGSDSRLWSLQNAIEQAKE